MRFYAVDIDPTCIRMTRINFTLYGMIGQVKCANSLTDRDLFALPEPQQTLYRDILTAKKNGKEDRADELTRQLRGAQIPMFAAPLQEEAVPA